MTDTITVQNEDLLKNWFALAEKKDAGFCPVCENFSHAFLEKNKLPSNEKFDEMLQHFADDPSRILKHLYPTVIRQYPSSTAVDVEFVWR